MSMIVEVLCEEGFQIIEAPSADAALELLKSSSLRLIVTDINLPGMRDGIDPAIAARTIKPEIPVIFISGRPMKFRGRVPSAYQANILSPEAIYVPSANRRH